MLTMKRARTVAQLREAAAMLRHAGYQQCPMGHWSHDDARCEANGSARGPQHCPTCASPMLTPRED